MKTLIAFTLVAFSGLASIAAPHPGPRPIHRPPPHHVHYGPRVHHYHYHPGPAFVGGVVGGLLGAAVVEATRPAIVATPAPQPTVIIQSPAPLRQVWIEGRYEDRVQANGVIIKVWVPGHWVTVP